jgi:hypothetical protein
MLTFTYTLKNFGKMPVNDNNRRREFEGGGFPRGGGDRGGRGFN